LGRHDSALATQRQAIGLDSRNEKLRVCMAGSMDQLFSVLIDDILRHDHVVAFTKHNHTSITFVKNRHNGAWS
jgi:hypothetical protein